MLFKILYKLNDLRHRIIRTINKQKNLLYFTKAGAEFAEVKSVSMNGKSLISISKSSTVYIGKGFILNSGGSYCIDNQLFSKINVANDAILRIGDYSGISNTVIQCMNRIEIGNHVNIGAGCIIMDSDFHSIDYRLRKDRDEDALFSSTAPITIEDYVFIGARSIILKGVHIGEGATIGAGSVVTNDIPAKCIAAGNPCRIIRYIGE